MIQSLEMEGAETVYQWNKALQQVENKKHFEE